MAVVTIDSYSESNSNNSYDVTETSHYVGQSFSVSRSWLLHSCKFYLCRDSTSVVEDTVALVTPHQGVYGTSSTVSGGELATSDTVSASGFGLLTFGLVTYNFTGNQKIRLVPNTKYCLVSYRYSGADNVFVGLDTASPTHDGNEFVVGTPNANKDAIFYVYGEETVAELTTQNCSSVTSNSAVGNGTITIAGGVDVTRRGFCYKTGTTGDPTVSDSVVYDDGTFVEGTYTKSITGLSGGTNYRVRAYCINSIGTSYGSTVQLTTSAAFAPTVTTTTTSRLGKTVVSFGGNVTDAGDTAVTDRGIYWGTSEFSQSNKIVSTSGSGAYSIVITGLTADTTYYYKAYATNSVGTSYGDVIMFKTGGDTPTAGVGYPLPPSNLT